MPLDSILHTFLAAVGHTMISCGEQLISEDTVIRTVISLDEEDKRWLDRKAAHEGISMTEMIRRAVKRLRREETEAQAFDRMLRATSGVGPGDDGLAIQERLRNEWRRRPA